MLTQICAELKNYFSSDRDRFIGDFEIISGTIVPPVSIEDGQYYRIVGSIFNDGVHQYGNVSDVLKDEPTFHGAIWLMRVPDDVINLAIEIAEWQDKNGDTLASPYQSESFGGYSYSKATASSGTNGAYSWKDAFASRLNRYRKIRSV